LFEQREGSIIFNGETCENEKVIQINFNWFLEQKLKSYNLPSFMKMRQAQPIKSKI